MGELEYSWYNSPIKGNKFATGKKIKAADESKLNDCPGHIVYYNSTVFNYKLKL